MRTVRIKLQQFISAQFIIIGIAGVIGWTIGSF